MGGGGGGKERKVGSERFSISQRGLTCMYKPGKYVLMFIYNHPHL